MRIPFVGEVGDANPYDAICVLAQDVDISEGTLQGRFGDVELTSGNRRRVFVRGDGGVVDSAQDGYGFVWGNDVYLINSEGSWRKNGDSGTVLNAPSLPPSISGFSSVLPTYSASSASEFNPQPGIFSSSGWCKWSMTSSGLETKTVTLTFSSAQDLTDYLAFGVAVMLPQGFIGSFRASIGGQTLPLLKRHVYSTTYHVLSFDLSPVSPRDSISSIVFSYECDSSHDLFIFNMFWKQHGVSGKAVYIATLTRSNVESVASTPLTVPALRDWLYSWGVQLTVTGVANGDSVRVYRAVGERYYLVASGTATGSSINLTDRGTIGEEYVPGGVLPYGPAVVWGNRVVIASGRELYFSGEGLPEKYSQAALSDLSDPYRLILPEVIVALDVVDGALVAYGRQNAWLWQPVRRLFAEDNFDSILPQRIDAPIPLSAKSVDNGAVAAADGLYVGGSKVLHRRWVSSAPIVLKRGRMVCVADGATMHVWQQGQQGWVRYSLPSSTPYWLAWDGQYPVLAGSGGVHRIGAGTSRMVSKWRSGRLTAGNKFVLDWLRVFTSMGCRVTVMTDVGNFSEKTFTQPDRWKPADATAGGRALRWAQLEVNLSQSQKCEAIELELRLVAVK